MHSRSEHHRTATQSIVRPYLTAYGSWQGSAEEDREPGAPAGHLLQAPSRAPQEGQGALRALRR